MFAPPPASAAFRATTSSRLRQSFQAFRVFHTKHRVERHVHCGGRVCIWLVKQLDLEQTALCCKVPEAPAPSPGSVIDSMRANRLLRVVGASGSAGESRGSRQLCAIRSNQLGAAGIGQIRVATLAAQPVLVADRLHPLRFVVAPPPASCLT